MHATKCNMILPTWLNVNQSPRACMNKWGKGHMMTHKFYQFKYQNKVQIDLQ